MNWIVVGANNVGNITNIRREENRWFEALPALPPPQTARSLEATILSVANLQSFILLDLIPYIWHHILEVGYHLSDINLSNHGSDVLYLLLHIFHIAYLVYGIYLNMMPDMIDEETLEPPVIDIIQFEDMGKTVTQSLVSAMWKRYLLCWAMKPLLDFRAFLSSLFL